MTLDFAEVNRQFRAWAMQYVKREKGEWISVDGKALAGTAVVQSSQHKQAFVSLVSVYCAKQKLVLANSEVLNHKQSEIPVVQSLIEALHLKEVTFSLDALHCQKKQPPSLKKVAVIM
jgi:hypothetical protein